MKNQLKIAAIVTPFPALSETFILNRITGLIDRGHSVDIYASQPRETDEYVHQTVLDYNLNDKTSYETKPASTPLLEIYRRLQAPLSIIKYSGVFRFLKNYPGKKQIRNLTRFKEGKKYDLIHAFFGMNGNLAVQARKLGILDGPIAVSFHGIDLSSEIKENTSIYDKLFQKGDLFLPVCEYYKKRLIRLGCPAEKIFVHPSAIDVNQFGPTDKNRSSTKVSIISIGRLVEKKGFIYSIEAVAQYMNENPDKEITYTIIGEGRLKNELLSKVRAYNLTSKIKIKASVNQEKIVSEVQASDILICPSVVAENGDEDTVPNVLKEAMACELPVIASRHGGIPELVQHKENGLLIPEKNIEAMKEALNQLVNSPLQRAEMGEKGRKFVENNYEIESRNDIISREYIKLAQKYSER